MHVHLDGPIKQICRHANQLFYGVEKLHTASQLLHLQITNRPFVKLLIAAS